MGWYDQEPEFFVGGFTTQNLTQSLGEFVGPILEEDLQRTCRSDLRERVEWWRGTLEEFLRYHRGFRFSSGDGREGGPGYEIWVREIPLEEWVELSHEFDVDTDDVGGWDCESEIEEGEDLSGEEFERHMLQIRSYDLGDLVEYEDYPDIDCDGLVDESEVEVDCGDDRDDRNLPIEGGISFWG